MAQDDPGGGVEPEPVVDPHQVAVGAPPSHARGSAFRPVLRGSPVTYQQGRPSMSASSGTVKLRLRSIGPGYRHEPIGPASEMARSESRSVTSVLVPAQLRRPSLTAR